MCRNFAALGDTSYWKFRCRAFLSFIRKLISQCHIFLLDTTHLYFRAIEGTSCIKFQPCTLHGCTAHGIKHVMLPRTYSSIHVPAEASATTIWTGHYRNGALRRRLFVGAVGVEKVLGISRLCQRPPSAYKKLPA